MSTQKRLSIDCLDFVRVKRRIQGQDPLFHFVRFIEDLPAQANQGTTSLVHWVLEGCTGSRGEPLLSLSVQASPLVECQHCLGLFNYQIDVQTLLEIVKSEQDLENDVDSEGEIDYDANEKVLASTQLDVLDLVEDELILALPYVAKHEICPDQADLPEDNLEKKPSPFAVLEKLKK